MSWFQPIDLALFRFINLKLSNPLLDLVLPQCSSNGWFIPGLLALAVGLLWKGGARARLMVFTLALTLGLADALVINPLKHAAARPRPFHAVSEAKVLVGKGNSGSMPSSHTSTWFAATVIVAAFYRRSWRFLLPLAAVIGFSRVYLGVHYFSDVLVGALLGATSGALGLWLLSRLWQFAGPRWFPLWFRQLPTWIPPTPKEGVERGPSRAGLGSPVREAPGGPDREKALWNLQWVRLGYLLIGLFLLARLIYVAGDEIELSEDEAYQWLWSKHLALSYYSKPPMIALLHFLGTSLWGDTVFGVRFCPPVFSAVLGVLMLRFFAREVDGRAGFYLVLIANTTPLLAAGSILMTIDPPLVLFWSAAMVAAWRAMQPGGTTGSWIWMGVWLGLALLSKYSALFFIPSLALFFVLWPPARAQLRRPGPWLALIPLALCALPVLIWNAQHDWITVQHVSENAKLDKEWQPDLGPFLEFTVSQLGLLNPVFFGAMLVAGVGFWAGRPERPLERYLFAMGAPVFIGYWLYTFHSRVQPNWIAPAVVPLLGLTLLYWHRRWRDGYRPVVPCMVVGLVLGAFITVLLHDTSLLRSFGRAHLSARIDPLRRVRGISEIARVAGEAQQVLEQSDGKPAFIIASHYGLTGQITFYLPKARLGLPGSPLVYPRFSRAPRNQFYFWPEYSYRLTRRGQNAIYVRFNDKPEPPPRDLVAEFQSVTDLGSREIKSGRRVVHRIQLFACRNVL